MCHTYNEKHPYIGCCCEYWRFGAHLPAATMFDRLKGRYDMNAALACQSIDWPTLLCSRYSTSRAVMQASETVSELFQALHPSAVQVASARSSSHPIGPRALQHHDATILRSQLGAAHDFGRHKVAYCRLTSLIDPGPSRHDILTQHHRRRLLPGQWRRTCANSLRGGRCAMQCPRSLRVHILSSRPVWVWMCGCVGGRVGGWVGGGMKE
ncbi:hypothetical protein EDC01DRAFT_498665 [Geopyxis carbonaria]|nr:hypothetical protein EDC01DRAFT_498665 [Geopyxis carbonaria]